jgi:CRP-like cAMP-binding protein
MEEKNPEEIKKADNVYVNFKEGDIIFNEGDEGQHLFLILNGEIDIYKEMEGRTIVLATIKKGDVFGEMAILGDEKRTASAKVISKEVQLMQVTKEYFIDQIKKNPTFVFNILKNLSKRLETINNELIVLKYVISA